MEILHQLLDFILHVDVHLRTFVEAYGAWVYALLFLIIFVETGVVVMPFLPGDSLLFVVGALCGAGLMNLPLAMGLLCIAAILGDPAKRSACAQILGQAYITAVQLIRHNREQTLRIAETLVERKELHGDEVVEVLDAAGLEAPPIDVTDETIWPKL